MTAVPSWSQQSAESYRAEPLEQHDFDDERWQQLREELVYEGEASAPRQRQQPAENEQNRTEKSWFDRDGSLGWRIALIVLLASGIGLLLWYALRQYRAGSVRGKDHAAPLVLEHIEANLETTDLDAYIRQAEANGDFQTAIRLHFLALLKDLHQRNWIRWSIDKTNAEYLRTLRPRPRYDEIRELTRHYEWAWYGDHPLPEPDYRPLAARFLDFRRQLPTINRLVHE